MRDDIEATMNLTCHKYVNTTTGLISVLLQWEVQNISHVLQAIEDYSILSKLMDTQGDIPSLIAARPITRVPANVCIYT